MKRGKVDYLYTLQDYQVGMQTMVEASPSLLVITDQHGKNIFVSPNCQELTGYSEKELLKKLKWWVHPDDSARAKKKFDQTIQKGAGYRGFEYKAQKKNGEVWYASSSWQVFKDNKGRFKGIVLHTIDITKRKRLEHLFQSLNRASLAMERAETDREIFTAVGKELVKMKFVTAVFLLNQEGTRLDLQFTSYDAKIVKIYEKMVGVNAYDFGFPLKVSEEFCQIVENQDTLYVTNMEKVLLDVLPERHKKFFLPLKKKLKLPLAINAPLVVENNVIGVLCVLSNDLTGEFMSPISTFAHLVATAWAKTRLIKDLEISLAERLEAEKRMQKLQAQLQQAQKMEAIGTLAGGIAHDFNNILAVILGNSELLKAKLSPESDTIENVDEILKAGQRAADLVRHILTFSRVSEQKYEPVLMQELVREALHLLRSSIPASIEIRQKVKQCEHIMGDATQLEQVIMNLCTNAYHALVEAKGMIEVSLGEEYLTSFEEEWAQGLGSGKYVRLSVRDTGVGMDHLVLERIFEPYFTTKEKSKGTGLGLSVVHGIVKAHHGAIHVRSQPGRGSTFSIYLPVAKEQINSKKQTSKRYPTGNESILFIDDEPALVMVAEQMLIELGYRVKGCTDCQEALEIFVKDSSAFDLVITDMTMPGLTGEQLGEKFLAVRPDIPIILITGYSDRINQESSRSLGFKGFLMKPYTVRDFAMTIRQVLDTS